MGVIFYFSSQPFSRQDLKPWLSERIPDRSVERLFGDVRVHYGKKEVSVQRLGEVQFVQFWIRKAAHVFEYFVLGLLAVRLWRKLNHQVSWLGGLLVLLFCAFYAMTDEIHQYFTGDRTPMVQDVILDSAAALAAILLYTIRARWLLQKL
jgi:VanZ family protein